MTSSEHTKVCGFQDGESYKAEDKKMWELKDDIENHKYCKGRKHAFEDVLEKVEWRITQFEKELNANGNKTD